MVCCLSKPDFLFALAVLVPKLPLMLRDKVLETTLGEDYRVVPIECDKDERIVVARMLVCS